MNLNEAAADLMKHKRRTMEEIGHNLAAGETAVFAIAQDFRFDQAVLIRCTSRSSGILFEAVAVERWPLQRRHPFSAWRWLPQPQIIPCYVPMDIIPTAQATHIRLAADACPPDEAHIGFRTKRNRAPRN
jgi:hypothetical protein